MNSGLGAWVGTPLPSVMAVLGWVSPLLQTQRPQGDFWRTRIWLLQRALCYKHWPGNCRAWRHLARNPQPHNYEDDYDLSVDHVFLLRRDPLKLWRQGRCAEQVRFISSMHISSRELGEGGGKREEEGKFSISKVTHWQPSMKIILQFSHLASISFLLRHNWQRALYSFQGSWLLDEVLDVIASH